MPRRKQIPVRKNFAFLIPALPYIATGTTLALKVAGTALVGATIGTAAYGKYVASEEEKRRKNLPKLAERLENEISNVRAGRLDDTVLTMPTSIWLAPTDDAQASLRVAWLYMLAAIKNPQHREVLLKNAQEELEEFYYLESGTGQSFPPNAPELQWSYEKMLGIFNNLGVTGIEKFLTGVTITQDPDEIAWQQNFEEKQKDDASLWNAGKETLEDLKEAGKDLGKDGKCTAEILRGLITGENPPSCKFTKWQWFRVKAMVYGSVGLVAAAYILPPIFRVAAPIVERALEKKD